MKHLEKELRNSKNVSKNLNYWSVPSVIRSKPYTEEELLIQAESIIQVVTHYYQFSYGKIVGKYRGPNAVVARHIAMYLVRQKTKLSLLKIGKLFKRHHTSIIHAIRNVEEQADHPYDESVRNDLFNINLLI